MDVATYIRERKTAIAETWEAEVSSTFASLRGLPRPALIDHLPEFLDSLGDWIEGKEEAALVGFRALADGHALQRLGFGINLETLALEYSRLRHIILRELLNVSSTGDIRRQLIRFDEGMDLAINEAVRTYAARRDALRERFVAILAHDLRNPLGAVLMSAEALLQLETCDEPVRAHAARVHRGGQRMKRMIDSVVEFAQGHLGGGIPVTPTLNDLGDLCRAAVDEARAAHAEPRIVLDIRGQDLRGPFDADRVHQAMANLLSNARHYGHGAITVKVWDAGDGRVLCTSVHNDGPPIAKTLLPTLFDPFARGDMPSRHGLGLGLFIVNQIALAHGAVCTVDSSVAGGTTFTVRWPRARLDDDPRKP